MKFIFKTLIKVPIIIVISYLIFNLFAFTVSYFRLLGLSYVVMQTAIENNYVPNSEQTILNNYGNSLETAVLNNICIGCDTQGSNQGDNVRGSNASSLTNTNKRVQYGRQIVITVSGRYNFMMPGLNYNVAGYSGVTNPGLVSQGGAEGLVKDAGGNDNNNIVIQYTVPALTYYPDLGL